MKEQKPQYRKYPYQCQHPKARRECKPDCQHPKIITCKDCGAILLMVIADGQTMKPAPVPLAATLFGEDGK